jgi:hypothetical protein
MWIVAVDDGGKRGSLGSSVAGEMLEPVLGGRVVMLSVVANNWDEQQVCSCDCGCGWWVCEGEKTLAGQIGIPVGYHHQAAPSKPTKQVTTQLVMILADQRVDYIHAEGMSSSLARS